MGSKSPRSGYCRGADFDAAAVHSINFRPRTEHRNNGWKCLLLIGNFQMADAEENKLTYRLPSLVDFAIIIIIKNFKVIT